MAGPGGAVERGEPVPGLGLQVGPAVQQERHHVGLAPLGGHVQGGDVVLEKEGERDFEFIMSKKKLKNEERSCLQSTTLPKKPIGET